MRRDFSCVLALIAALLGSPAAAQQVVHGENSTFIAPSVKLAWAVKRGASEAQALIVIRVVADPSHRFIRVDGVDPFTKDRKAFIASRALDRETDLSIPRAQFADHPSTEIHFFANGEDVAANRAKLTVFYLGVPDTTPEFTGQREADAYFDHALGKQK